MRPGVGMTGWARGAACLWAVLLPLLAPSPGAAEGATGGLVLESRIPLGPVKGRIDHLAVDVAGKRLFVAELGNDSVGVVDLAQGKVVGRINGLAEPQGVGYDAANGTLYVANAKDGSVRLFDGRSLAPTGRIDLGDDADNVRVAPDRVLVGYGSGGLAAIDPRSHEVTSRMPLNGHPESFQFDAAGERVSVNVPERREIAVLDLKDGSQVASWPTGRFRSVFPMALVPQGGGLAVVARNPAALLRYGTDGTLLWQEPTCGDADDIFYDAPRSRFYVSCGDGTVAIQPDQAHGEHARIATAKGARTSLFVPDLDRLFVAAPASSGAAELLVFRPSP